MLLGRNTEDMTQLWMIEEKYRWKARKWEVNPGHGEMLVLFLGTSRSWALRLELRVRFGDGTGVVVPS